MSQLLCFDEAHQAVFSLNQKLVHFFKKHHKKALLTVLMKRVGSRRVNLTLRARWQRPAATQLQQQQHRSRLIPRTIFKNNSG